MCIRCAFYVYEGSWNVIIINYIIMLQYYSLWYIQLSFVEKLKKKSLISTPLKYDISNHLKAPLGQRMLWNADQSESSSPERCVNSHMVRLSHVKKIVRMSVWKAPQSQKFPVL